MRLNVAKKRGCVVLQYNKYPELTLFRFPVQPLHAPAILRAHKNVMPYSVHNLPIFFPGLATRAALYVSQFEDAI
jgi:hypothetical protein